MLKDRGFLHSRPIGCTNLLLLHRRPNLCSLHLSPTLCGVVLVLRHHLAHGKFSRQLCIPLVYIVRVLRHLYLLGIASVPLCMPRWTLKPPLRPITCAGLMALRQFVLACRLILLGTLFSSQTLSRRLRTYHLFLCCLTAALGLRNKKLPPLFLLKYMLLFPLALLPSRCLLNFRKRRRKF